ncbi:hypothetical protein APSETT444_003370 [Aspergillus pseudonomiae]
MPSPGPPLPLGILVDEEISPVYNSKYFYPAKPGEVLASRYQTLVKVGWGVSFNSMARARSARLWDMIEGKELFRHVHDQQGRYDAKLHIAEMIALLGPPPPEITQRYQYMREYSWPQPVRREDDKACGTAEEYFCGPFFDNNGITGFPISNEIFSDSRNILGRFLYEDLIPDRELSLNFVLVLYIAVSSPLRRVPGPLYTSLTRLPLKFASLTGNRIYFVHELHRKYGPIVRVAPDEVDISSLAEFREIHRAGTPFLKSKWYEKFVPSKRSGVFTMRDPKEHAVRRKLFARPFSKSELRRTWEPAVKEKVQLAVSQIRLELKTDGKSDLLKWWTFLATDVSGHLMFGESFDMLRVGKKNQYIHVLESTMMGSGIGAELPLLAWLGRHIPLSSFRNMFRATDYLFQYGQRAIINSRTTSNSSRNIFAGMLHESEKGDGIITDEEVVLEAGNLIVAGSDTTAITLTYLVWAVLSQPNLQRELEEEVNSLSADFNDAALEELPLLNAVIMEALRLYGAAPGALPRETPEGGATFCGYFIPQGMTVSTQAYSIHRDGDVYPDPERFDVSRWLAPETSASELAKKAFSPFGAGEWVHQLGGLCGPGAGLRSVEMPFAEIDSIFDSIFGAHADEINPDSNLKSVSNPVRLYGSNEDM